MFVCEAVSAPEVAAVCDSCGKDFMTNKPPRGATRRWCDDQCKRDLNKARSRVSREKSPGRDTKAGRCASRQATQDLQDIECRACGSSFPAKVSTRPPRYCLPCAVSRKALSTVGSYLRHRAPLKGRRGRLPHDKHKLCVICGSPFEHLYNQTCCVEHAKELGRQRRQPAKTRECLTCGDNFRPYRLGPKQKRDGFVQLFCSKDCRSGNVIPFEQRRLNKGPHRRVTKRLNPIVVLERDKWRCHICGIATPKRLRGTTDDRAPEVDHIVTVADGGVDSYENMACACRRCNRHKGRKSFGQLRMFA